MINDIGIGSEPIVYIYPDTRLQELLLVSAQLVQPLASFPNAYTVNISELLLTPDPTALNTRDDSFINLVLIKSACIIDNSEARLAAGKGVLLKDDKTTVDARTQALTKLDILKRGWCVNFNDALYAYMLGNVSLGMAITGPFRIGACPTGDYWAPDDNLITHGYRRHN